MIRITDRWAVHRDAQQWVLTETYNGEDKHGNPKTHTRESYHPWLDVAIRYAADKDCEGAETLMAVSGAYLKLEHTLRDRVRALSRGYDELHSELSETRKQLRDAQRQLKQQEKLAA